MRKLLARFSLVPFFIKDSYSSQIQGHAIVGLRVRYTCFGLAYWPKESFKRPWYVPHTFLTFCSHTGSCDQWQVFKLTLGRYSIGYRTQGESTPETSHRPYGWMLNKARAR